MGAAPATKTAEPALVVTPGELARGAFSPDEVGGKGAGLARLLSAGVDVPETWVLGARAFRRTLRELPPFCEPRSLLRVGAGRAAYARADDARRAILGAKLPPRVAEALERVRTALEPHAPWGLAVRSSATCEDGALVSLAGIAETRLGVRGEEAFADAVRAVWASVASPRALAYLAAHGIRDLGMAVVVQPVVQASAAGVLLTRGTWEGREARVVNAGLGLGAPVVDGVQSPDRVAFDADGRVLGEAVAHKPTRLVVGPEGPEVTASPAPDAPALGAPQIAALAAVARRLEALDPRPGAEPAAWDVEFACGDDGTTTIVQARPAADRALVEGGTRTTVWSRVNVGEALPGVATPFTWSVAGAYAEAGFHRAFAALGCVVPRSARLVGNVHGRLYLNLSDFMRVAAQVPWLDARVLVELGGGAGAEALADVGAGVSRRRFWAKLPVTAKRLAQEQLALDATVADFVARAERERDAARGLDLGVLPDEGVARRLRAVQRLLASTGDVMLTCAAGALGAHLALRALLSRVDKARAERLAEGLVRGIRDLESARPAIGIVRVSELLRREPELRAAVERGEVAAFDDLPEGPVRRALHAFLDAYGHRAVREAELSMPRWRESPADVFALVRASLRVERDVERDLLRARASADREMDEVLPALTLPERTLLRHLVVRAQRAARLREQTRDWVTRVLGMLRDVALEAHERLLGLCPALVEEHARAAHASPGLDVPAVFLLTIDEVAHALEAGRDNLVPLVAARRAELARDLARPDPPVTFVGAPPPAAPPPASSLRVSGLPASPGVVEGRARVLAVASDGDALLPGEVLVVRTTDVGWTPLFFVAAGVVTELGGPLSHAAIVARELSVPTVVNAEAVTTLVRTGDRVRVDGDRGVVEILERGR